jgi:hypothetical protein
VNDCYPSIRFVLLPINPLDTHRRCDPGEGFLSTGSPPETTPHPALRATFSHKGRRKTNACAAAFLKPRSSHRQRIATRRS